MQVNSLVALLSCALASQAAFANQHAHEAHVHGEVTFHVAQDGQQLLVEIEAPGADVVGFEYAPRNDAERDALQKAQTTLADGASLLLFPAAAQCQLLESEVANDADSHADHDHHAHDEHKHHDDHDKHAHDEHNHHDEHDEHAHDEHKHHDEHDEHAHDEHKHHDDHDHHKTSADSHNTFHAHYLFECGNIAALDTIDVQWFKQFPATQRVETHLFLDNWQGSQTLTSEQAILTFRQ